MSVANAALGLTSGQVDRVLATASRAPSVQNTQPWRFRVTPAAIELHADLSRRLPSTDPDDRELRLSCGAALFNLRLALRGAGVRPLVTLIPDGLGHRGPAGRDALAVIRNGGRTAPSADIDRFLAAMSDRRSNRDPFTDQPVSHDERLRLARAVEAERSWLHVVLADELGGLRDLVALAQREQQADPGCRAELRMWADRDGFGPGSSNGCGEPQPPDALFRKDFDARNGQASPAESGPLVGLVCSFHNGPAAELQAGQALQRLLLTATALGISASFLSSPIEVPYLRGQLRRGLGSGLHPHAILCLGYGRPAPPTGRRPVAELLMTEATRS